MENEDQAPIDEITAGAAGAPEGAAAAEPTSDDVAKMYKELGIKAPAPTGATKGRPKTSNVRTKDAPKKGVPDSDDGRKADDDGKGQSKDAPASTKDGTAGNEDNKKVSKDGEDDRQVSGESDDADKGVRGAESKSKEDSERGRKEDPEQRDDGAGQTADESDDEAEEGEDVEGKRPGKSNPKIEQRFQRLTEEKREREQEIIELRQKLEETMRQQTQSKIAQEDPEYTIEDFAKVRDEAGNIIDLDPERAELAWRRWKDGYDARSEERQAKEQHERVQQQQQEEYAEKIMRSSVEAYDTLADLMDEYPELVKGSGKYDEQFATLAIPLIEDAIVYQPGTEPGNEEGVRSVIVGLRLNPKTILAAMNKLKEAKRTLPLNGINDNVETRSNVSVQHSRSSDPTVNAANELYRSLNIDKRL